ncbi:glycoside hydrolase family 76 protein [Streptomyces montanisoli]|uniref:Hydrolase n=1 Tax=Streptomyces montanisoli TaxID=2798581 RepID=A0A940MD69_9ACTN|nr:glycoside hydrolase family 76 protein [Streptomyces montanisoli]MBP0457805.1 hydrolase [Streptomyces montanisoli]
MAKARTIRRAGLLLTALATTAAGLLSAPAAQAAGSRPADWAARAETSYRALQHELYLGPTGHGLYRESTPAAPGGNPYSYLWEFREATQATLYVRGIPHDAGRYGKDVADRFAALRQYASTDPAHPGYDSYLPAPLGTGGDLFFDDNAVVGLSYLTGYRAGGGHAMLDGARAAFTTDLRAWDDDPAKECPGGMHWVESSANTMRAANVTGLFAQLSAGLYQITHQPRYLDWARRAYDWNRDCLRQAPGLYQNDRDDDGSVNTTLWTYNSGAMIGTATELYRATGDRHYLDQAVEDADGALAYWTADDRLYNQPAVFNSFLFQDLLLLDSQHHDPRYRAALSTYAERLWADNRDPATGLFHFQASNGGAPDPAQPVGTLNQAAAVQLLSLLAWDPDDYDRTS